MKIVEIKEGSLIELSVRPRSKKFGIDVQGEDVMVFATEEPTKGKVNREIMKELSRIFHTRVVLVSGFASTEKRLLISNVRKNEAERVLRTLQNCH